VAAIVRTIFMQEDINSA